ncbi:trigger factor [Lachnospiraceae bacterium 62-35]
MKKYAAICVLGMAAAIAFSGCGKKEETAETTQAQTEASQAEAETDAVEVKGEVKLGEYKGIEVTKQDTAVTEEELQASIDSTLEMNAELIEIDRAAQIGDTVNIDYVGLKDGTAFEGGTAEGYDLTLGSGQFIDGFEDGLVGAVKEQKLSLNLSFPENYGNSDLAGQAVVFEVTVNAVKEKKLPELDNDLVKKISDGEFTTVEDWKENVRTSLKEQKESEGKAMRQSELIQAVIDSSVFTGIEESVQQTFEQQLSQAENMAAIYGMKLSDMAAMYQMSEEEYKDFLRSQVENNIKIELALREIARLENLKVTDEDRQEVAEENQAESVDQLLEQLGEGGDKILDEYALSRNVLEFLESNAVEK